MSVPPPRITSMEVTARTSPDSLIEALNRNEVHRRAGDAEMLEMLAALDEEWPEDPRVPDLASELAARQGISARTAAERLRMARALRGLPGLRAAHANGLISWDQLRWLTRFVTLETDAQWAERGSHMPPWKLKLEAERQARVRREQAERDHAMRSVRMAWDEEGRFLDANITLAAEQGAAFESALNAAAQNITVEDDVEDRRGARLADALVQLVTSSGPRSQTPTLVIHADAEVLPGRTMAGGTCRRPRPEFSLPTRPFGAWRARRGSGGRWSMRASRWESSLGDERSPTTRWRCWSSATAGAPSQAADRRGSSTPITSATGRTVARPRWTTSPSCAVPTTAGSTRVDGRSAADHLTVSSSSADPVT
jgi:hypothetical protein